MSVTQLPSIPLQIAKLRNPICSAQPLNTADGLQLLNLLPHSHPSLASFASLNERLATLVQLTSPIACMRLALRCFRDNHHLWAALRFKCLETISHSFLFLLPPSLDRAKSLL